MSDAADIDWETINAKLPYERNDESKEKRRELFKQFDPNSNGYLSLAEVRKLSGHSLKCPSLHVTYLCVIGVASSINKVAISINQVDKGMRDVLEIEELFDCKTAVNASFHFAKDKSQVNNITSDLRFLSKKIKSIEYNKLFVLQFY